MASAIASAEAFGASFDVAPMSEALELGEGLEGDPALAFRRTLGMFATGVTVLTTRVREQVHGMTVKQLGTLNRFHVPGNAMTVDMVINILFVLFIGNIFGVLAASNLGYVLAHMFALSGFVILRRTRPDWPRPIRLGAIWTPIAAILAVWCGILTVVGFGWMQVAAGGYGDTKEKVIGVAVLAIGILLFLFRRIVQDKESPHWREEVPTMPDAAQSALLAEEMRPA